MTEVVKKALEAARTLFVIDELSPAEHRFEIKKRNEVRHKVIEMIDAALAEG